MDWQERDGVRWLEAELPGARAAFSTRVGGVSEAPYEALNVAVKTGDEPGTGPRQPPRGSRPRSGSRPRTSSWAARSTAPSCTGTTARRSRRSTPTSSAARRGRRPRHRPARAGAAGDGRRLPADRARRARRGGDGPRRLARARRRDRRRRPPSGSAARGAAIGPGIGPCCYEVGEEVLAEFADIDGVAGAAGCSTCPPSRGRCWSAPASAEVDAADLCTSCNPELFYSHRRDGERTGRQAGLAWLES